LPATPSNRLRRIRLEGLDNVAVHIRSLVGQKIPTVVELPEQPRQVAFSVTWVSPGPFTLRMVVEDDCGSWGTFVGGGANAWSAFATSTPSSTASITPTQTVTPTRTHTPTPSLTLTPTSGAITLQQLDGRSELRSANGTFLGDISSNKLASNSICNKLGSYGSALASFSVRNKLGTYGSSLSNESAYNQIASFPPRIVYQGNVVGHLTKNSLVLDGVDPDVLFAAYGCT